CPEVAGAGVPVVGDQLDGPARSDRCAEALEVRLEGRLQVELHLPLDSHAPPYPNRHRRCGPEHVPPALPGLPSGVRTDGDVRTGREPWAVTTFATPPSPCSGRCSSWPRHARRLRRRRPARSTPPRPRSTTSAW